MDIWCDVVPERNSGVGADRREQSYHTMSQITQGQIDCVHVIWCDVVPKWYGGVGANRGEQYYHTTSQVTQDKVGGVHVCLV